MDNSSATVMLGLEGMAVLAVSERDGELEYAIETTASTGWCPVCGAVARLHDRRPTWVRDLPAGDRPVTLVWVKRIWRCTHVECEQRTWTETHPQIRARASWSERARKQACRRVGRDGHSVAAVARDVGVGWATVMAAVVDYGTPLIEHPDRIEQVAAVGVDVPAEVPKIVDAEIVETDNNNGLLNFEDAVTQAAQVKRALGLFDPPRAIGGRR